MKRRNKIISIVLAIVLTISVFTIVPLNVGAVQTIPIDADLSAIYSYGNYRYRVLDDDNMTAELTAITNTTGDVTIPSKIGRFTIISIADEAFYGCFDMLSVDIPNTITHIGDSAFNDCEALTDVEIGAAVKSIDNSAFYDCTSLMKVTIPANVESIGDHAFGYYPTPYYGPMPMNGFTICGSAGSAAQTYANNNHFTFNKIA